MTGFSFICMSKYIEIGAMLFKNEGVKIAGKDNWERKQSQISIAGESSQKCS
jgi:hypothetical protein